MSQNTVYIQEREKVEEFCRFHNDIELTRYLQENQNRFTIADLDFPLRPVCEWHARNPSICLALLKTLIAHGADVNLQCRKVRMETPLHFVCANNDDGCASAYLLPIVQLLVQHGANVNAQNVYHATPLDFAARNGSNDIVTYLLQHGADPNVESRVSNESPLQGAMRMKKPCTAFILLQHGADMSATPKWSSEQTPLQFIFSDHGSSVDVLKMLLEYRAPVNWVDGNGCSALYYAVKRKNLQLVELLLEIPGADPNLGQPGRDTPLHSACALDGGMEIVQSLLRHGADVNATNERHWTPLIVAIQKYDFALFDLLLEEWNADCTIPTDTLETPLHKACWFGSRRMIHSLLEHGANVNARDAEGRTPLHCVYDELDIAQMLTRHGADVSLGDNAGETPLFYCLRQGAACTANFLLASAGAHVDAVNQDGQQILHVMCGRQSVSKCRIDDVGLLLKFGANVNARDAWGQTPLFWRVSMTIPKSSLFYYYTVTELIFIRLARTGKLPCTQPAKAVVEPLWTFC